MSEKPTLSVLDRPNSYIGRSVERPNAKRLTQGRGAFVDDLSLPRMAHIAFARSPHAHADIVSIDSAAAAALPGVIRVLTMEDLKDFCTPWVGTLDHLAGIKSAEQYPLANGRVFCQGEPVAAVVATSRAIAEDGVDLVDIDYDELPAITDMATALDPGHSGDASRTGRQPLLGARAHRRRPRSGLQGRRPRGRGDARLQPAHRRHPGAARHRLRLQFRRTRP